MSTVTRAERNELIERHLPLAAGLARRYSFSAEAAEELAQVAALGLVKAASRFDAERGVTFAGFAAPTILGELKRHFRDTRWAVRVGRDLKERTQRVDAARERLSASLGRVPSAREVAAELGMDSEEVLEADAARDGRDAASLDSPVSFDDAAAGTLADMIGCEDERYELVEEALVLAPALAALPSRDRLVLRLRFVDELTQAQIGARIGVSQMHVSRILRRSLERLREHATAGAGYSSSAPSPLPPSASRECARTVAV